VQINMLVFILSSMTEKQLCKQKNNKSILLVNYILVLLKKKKR